MNDDVVAGSSSHQGQGPESHPESPHGDGENVARRDSPSSGAPPPESAAQRRKAGMHRKFQFMTHLMTNLDALVYAEVCALYYMDCSFFRLLIRLVVQSFFLSPKSDEFVLLMPTHRPHVVAVLVPNVLCILLHLFTPLPEASEAARGYLHGGIIVDFIGEKAPTSRLKLLLLDLAVLTLQCIMLAVHAERERLRKVVKPASRILGAALGRVEDPAAAPSEPAAAPTVADHDAEERGVLRDGPGAAEDGIELRPLRPRPREPDRSRVLSAEGAAHGRRTPDLRDYMLSGNAILGDFHVLHSIRTAGDDYQSAAAQSLQTLGYAATLARLAAEPRSRLVRLSAQRRQQQQGTGLV